MSVGQKQLTTELVKNIDLNDLSTIKHIRILKQNNNIKYAQLRFDLSICVDNKRLTKLIKQIQIDQKSD
jgi:hypothetical protein